MSFNAMQQRENRFTNANQYRDQNNQSHFPDTKLEAGEITAMNPWAIKKIPSKPIVWKGVAQ